MTCLRLGIAVWLTLIASALSADATRPRILVISESDSRLPYVETILDAMETALGPMIEGDGEYFIEYLDLLRFGTPAEREIQRDFLVSRYGTSQLDAIVVLGPNALAFVTEHHDEFGAGAPVIFGAVGSDNAVLGRSAAALPAFSGVLSVYDFVAATDLAMSVQKDATGIVVMYGSAPFDRAWRETAAAVFGDSYRGLPVRYVGDAPAATMIEEAAALDPRSIVLLLSIFVDSEGNRFVPGQFASSLAAASAAPVWSVYETFLGTGVVGGHVEDLARTGQDLAGLVRLAVADAPLPPALDNPGRPMVDWRALERFGLDEGNLPPESVVLFYEPTVWERYRTQIIVVAAILLAQAATIAALLVQRHRYLRTQEALTLERAQLVHVSRNMRLGQLSAALAHEINQPLAAILANAEAGARLAAREPLDRDETVAIFGDIASATRRAGDIIRSLRRLIVKGESDFDEIDLNAVVRSTLELLNNEIVIRDTRVVVELAPDRLIVRGNATQLQQVVLNLVLNAIEAMETTPAERRRMRVATGRHGAAGAQLCVEDNGPGVPIDRREEVFKPFVSDKAAGLGVGLSICRNIATAHGGTLGFADPLQGGARAVLTLPDRTVAA